MKASSLKTAVLTFLFSWLHGGALHAENWPRFRGVNGSGISGSTDIPSQWSEQNYRWTVDLPGTGNSSPVIWGDRLFVTAADEAAGKRWLLCYDKQTGQELWRAESLFSKHKKHKNNSFASSTPALDERHVYQLWHSPKQSSLIAYDHDGNQQWSYELGGYLHGQGGATSPIVAGELVVVAHDHKSHSFLVAVDRSNGEEKWKIPRDGKRACYSTPCVRKTESGNDELVFVHCYEGVTGVDPRTGRQTWHIAPFGTESQRALVSPILAGNFVIAGSGAAAGERQIVAIAIIENASGAEAREAYRLLRQSPHVPTPLAIGDRLYFWNDGGIATSYDAKTGRRIWQQRVGGNYFSSPIAVGDRIFSISTEGDVVVIAAADQFEVLARNPVGQTSRATMAVSENVLYIRTDAGLIAVGKR